MGRARPGPAWPGCSVAWGFADLSERGGNGSAEAPCGRRRKMGDESQSGPTGLLDREDDPRLTHPAVIAIVGQRDSPVHRRAVVVAGRMVVERVVDGTAHRRTVMPNQLALPGCTTCDVLPG